MVFVIFGVRADEPHADVPDPGPAASLQQRWLDPNWRAAHQRRRISRRAFPADTLPIAETDVGPGSLGTFLGSEPHFDDVTAWYDPCIADPRPHPLLRFDPGQKWWKVHEAIIRANVAASKGNYFVGCPDLIENFDTLAQLRGTQTLLTDLYDRPGWVKERIAEINQAYFEAYGRIYEMIAVAEPEHAKAGAVFGAFHLWAPGKVAKVQCDAAAMLSPGQFREFVAPALAAQCEWLDYPMFHLDGSDCIRHLDALLEIESLRAIQWTPQAGRPQTGSPQWFPLYKRVLDAGKSLQIGSGMKPHETLPVLDAIGSKGVFIWTTLERQDEGEELAGKVERYR